ncbi:aspartic proteinase CDR1-like [Lathyrus oleraceus]|uniref:aspartic proteinase CDR1-like n=1 Tax=Pisum sativum TaxID=3888 RepID=UPI0021D15788|nr:aspartic proteinase CDR1-like [Pisum sativum]
MSHFSFFIIFCCISRLIVISHATKSDFSVDLIHRDSYKSPLYNSAQTKPQRIFNDVRRSINRANYINRELSPTEKKFESSLSYDFVGEYLMSYLIGTPPFKVYGFFDTGSNFIWLHCKPYNISYNQSSHIFNPLKSSSYQNIPCFSKTCKSVDSVESTSCSYDGDACEYTIEYGDGTKSIGDISLETLTLNSTFGSIVSFPKIMIGCGHNNIMTGENKGPSYGVIGFGKGPTSFIKQLESVIDGKFSHCLIDNVYYQNSNLSSKLNFGDAAIVSGDHVVSSPMIKMIGNNQKDYYYLNLKAFSVGNKRVKYKGFKNKGVNASTHSILVDSGTPLTILPRHFYHRLESAVKKVVKLERFQDDTGNYKLCYKTTSQQSNFPVLTAHFSGADVKLDSNGVFFSIYEGVKCFAFHPSKHDLGLLGHKAMINYLVQYDLKKNIISFKPTDCSKG